MNVQIHHTRENELDHLSSNKAQNLQNLKAHTIVPTDINHKNATEKSTSGRGGAYNKISTAIDNSELTVCKSSGKLT